MIIWIHFYLLRITREKYYPNNEYRNLFHLFLFFKNTFFTRQRRIWLKHLPPIIWIMGGKINFKRNNYYYLQLFNLNLKYIHFTKKPKANSKKLNTSIYIHSNPKGSIWDQCCFNTNTTPVEMYKNTAINNSLNFFIFNILTNWHKF